MDKQDYNAVAAIDIKAPIEKVWDAITNPVIIKQYFHDTNVVTDWKVGNPIVWRGEWKGTAYEDKGVILAYQPSKLLSMTHWSPMSGADDIPENYRTLTYTLEPLQTDGTRLVLTQSNNPTQEVADSMAEKAWMPILQAMKALLEG